MLRTTKHMIPALVLRAAAFTAFGALSVSAGMNAAYAQTTTEGAIAATVADATGAAIPGAAITIRNEGTNAQVKLTSDGSGYFKAPELQPGNYTVTISASGFGTFTATMWWCRWAS